MPNASNTERVLAAIGGDDVTAGRTVLAVQGPRARERLAVIAARRRGRRPVPRRRRHRGGPPALVAGTGYTGEDGVEVAVDNADAARSSSTRSSAQGSRPRASVRATRCAWRRPCRCTATSSPRPSRRSRRGSAGSSAGPSPRSAAAPPLVEERERGPARSLRGFATSTRQPPRDGAEVLFAARRGRRDLWQLLAGPRARDRARARRHRRRPRARRRRARSTCAGGPSRRDVRRAPLREEAALMADYLPHTDDEVAEMLAFLGLGGLDELFSVVPAALRLAGGLDLDDGQPEPDVDRRVRGSGVAQPSRRARPRLLRGRGRLRPRGPRRGPRPRVALGVRDGLHALPGRGRPGRPAGGLRVPDDGRAARGAPRRQRLALRRCRRARRGAQPVRRGVGAPARPAVLRGPPALAGRGEDDGARDGTRPGRGAAR